MWLLISGWLKSKIFKRYFNLIIFNLNFFLNFCKRYVLCLLLPLHLLFPFCYLVPIQYYCHPKLSGIKKTITRIYVIFYSSEDLLGWGREYLGFLVQLWFPSIDYSLVSDTWAGKIQTAECWDIQESLGHLSLCLSFLWYGGFRVARLLTWQLRTPKVYIRESSRSLLPSMTWP